MKFLIIALFPTLVFAKSFLPNSFSASYTNSWQSATGSTRTENGTIDYKFPGNVKLDVKSNPQATFVTNKTTSWYYQPAFSKEEQGQVQVSKSSGHSVIKFLDSLKNGVEKSQYFSSKENGNDLVLTFNAAGEKEFSLKEVTIHGAKSFKDVTSLKDITSIDMKDSNGLTKKLQFQDLKEGISFSPDHFTFVIPPNTKTIK